MSAAAPAASSGRERPGARGTGGLATPGRPETTPVLPFLDRPLTSYYLVLGSAGLLVVIGLVMVLSASSVTAYVEDGSSYAIFVKQAMWTGIGLSALAIAVRLPVGWYRVLALVLLPVSVALLLAVWVPGISRSINGAHRWVGIGPIQGQPSEVAKLALVLWGADLLYRKRHHLHRWRHLVVPLIPVGLMLAALVMVEPDLGTSIVLIAILAALLWVGGAPMRLLALMAGVVAAFGGVALMMEPYRVERLTGFLDARCDVQSACWQAHQGLLALGSGGWWGLGLGASREKWAYLPNQYTDYIFAIIGEELGLIGTTAVLALFGILGYAGIRVARRNPEPFCRYASFAVTVWLLSQALVNIGAVVGLLPITGIPLPLVSFGGSALVPTLFAIGMLAAFARHEPGAPEALAMRGPGPVRRAFRWLTGLSLQHPTGRARLGDDSGTGGRRGSGRRSRRPGGRAGED